MVLMRKFFGQKGQTLIETMAALFILVTGVSASVGLAVYALNSSTSIVKQIVATGLAREGIEAVRNMRDTNWLKHMDIDEDCYNYEDLTAPNSMDGKCYKRWLGTDDPPDPDLPFCIDPTNSPNVNCSGGALTTNYALGFDYTQTNFWILSKQINNNRYGLTFNSTNSAGRGYYYTPGNINCANAAGMADYCRKIVITKQTDAPYDQDPNMTLLYVRSQVWWVDKKCPRAADFSNASPSCRMELDTYLTNWKNY